MMKASLRRRGRPSAFFFVKFPPFFHCISVIGRKNVQSNPYCLQWAHTGGSEFCITSRLYDGRQEIRGDTHLPDFELVGVGVVECIFLLLLMSTERRFALDTIRQYPTLRQISEMRQLALDGEENVLACTQAKNVEHLWTSITGLVPPSRLKFP